MDGYLSKPIRPAALAEVLADVAARSAGSCLTIGACALAALCRDLELAAKSGAAVDPAAVAAIRRQLTVAELELGLSLRWPDRGP